MSYTVKLYSKKCWQNMSGMTNIDNVHTGDTIYSLLKLFDISIGAILVYWLMQIKLVSDSLQ